MTATPTDSTTATPGPAPGPTPRFVDDRLAHWAATKPDEEAMTYLGRSWTWAEWDERVRRCTGMLADLGIGRGDVVAFLDKNHPACVELSLAAGALGAANAIINLRLAGEEIDYAVNDSGAKVLLVGSELRGHGRADPRAAHPRRARHRGHPRGRRRGGPTTTRPGWPRPPRPVAPATSSPTTSAW